MSIYTGYFKKNLGLQDISRHFAWFLLRIDQHLQNHRRKNQKICQCLEKNSLYLLTIMPYCTQAKVANNIKRSNGCSKGYSRKVTAPYS